MTKEKLRKILKESEALDIDSIPVEEKKSIHLFMEYGFTMSTFYLFFFKKAFRNGKSLALEIARNNSQFCPVWLSACWTTLRQVCLALHLTTRLFVYVGKER